MDCLSAARHLLMLEIRHKIPSGYEVKTSEDPWIPTTPARPARHRVPMAHPSQWLHQCWFKGMGCGDVG